MASVDDVLRFLTKRVTDTIYPGGTALPGIVNVPVKICPGWPVPAVLQKDISAGGVHVSVWPLSTERKVNTSLGRPYHVVSKGTPTLQITVNGNILALSGAASAPTNVLITLDGIGFYFHFRTGTTAEDATRSISLQLPRTLTVFSRIVVFLVSELKVKVTAAGTAVRELRRQAREFQITVWAPTPHLRNRTGAAIDTALSEQCHIDLGDAAPAQMLYVRQFDSDTAENWHVYRRDLIFSVNYATTQVISAPEVISTAVNLNGNHLHQRN